MRLPGEQMSEISFARALNEALRDSLADDPRVVVFGEDVAAAGGSFGVTRDLQRQFGRSRVRDAPISEAAIAGAAVGAAISGLRPVIEIMFMDFVGFAMDALVNQAAKAHFMFGGQCCVPLVARTPHGGGLGAGPQHSQCLEAWFAHVPGLKVVCPSNPSEGYALLRASIADSNPVIFVENKTLYGVRAEISDPRPQALLSRARVARSGGDVTIVTYGAMVGVALGAADELANRGIEVEIIDLRTLQPWDEHAVADSLQRTHRLVVFHEAVAAFGVGAEIVARMVHIAFDELDAPPLRVGAPFMPVPFSPSLESCQRPSARELIAAVLEVME